MNQTHLKYHSPIPRNGIYDISVKLLLALSILKVVYSFMKNTDVRMCIQMTLIQAENTKTG